MCLTCRQRSFALLLVMLCSELDAELNRDMPDHPETPDERKLRARLAKLLCAIPPVGLRGDSVVRTPDAERVARFLASFSGEEIAHVVQYAKELAEHLSAAAIFIDKVLPSLKEGDTGTVVVEETPVAGFTPFGFGAPPKGPVS